MASDNYQSSGLRMVLNDNIALEHVVIIDRGYWSVLFANLPLTNPVKNYIAKSRLFYWSRLEGKQSTLQLLKVIPFCTLKNWVEKMKYNVRFMSMTVIISFLT